MAKEYKKSSPLTDEQMARLGPIFSYLSTFISLELGPMVYNHLPKKGWPKPNGYDVGLNLQTLKLLGSPGVDNVAVEKAYEARNLLFHHQHKEVLNRNESLEDAVEKVAEYLRTHKD